MNDALNQSKQLGVSKFLFQIDNELSKQKYKSIMKFMIKNFFLSFYVFSQLIFSLCSFLVYFDTLEYWTLILSSLNFTFVQLIMIFTLYWINKKPTSISIVRILIVIKFLTVLNWAVLISLAKSVNLITLTPLQLYLIQMLEIKIKLPKQLFSQYQQPVFFFAFLLLINLKEVQFKQINYLTNFPQNLVLIIILLESIIFILLDIYSNKLSSIEETGGKLKSKSKQMTPQVQPRNATLTEKQQHPQSFQNQSPFLQSPVMQSPKIEDDVIIQSNYIIKHDQSVIQKCKTLDLQILNKMQIFNFCYKFIRSWIQNQQYLIISEEMDIVCQNFYLGKYKKQGIEVDPSNLQQIFIESIIQVASKEIFEMFPINQLEITNTEKQLNRSSENYRYNLKQKFQIKDLIQIMFEDFEKWRYYQIVLLQLENSHLDFSSKLIKVIVQSIKDHKFTVFLLESVQPEIIKHVLPSNDISQSVILMMHKFISESNNYLNCVLNLIIANQLDPQESKKYTYPIKLNSMKFNIFLNNIKDEALFFQNQLLLKINPFKVIDIKEEIFYIYDEILRSHDVSFQFNIETSETQIIQSDYNRLKQVIANLLELSLKFTLQSFIKIDVKLFNAQNLIITLKENGISKVYFF